MTFQEYLKTFIPLDRDCSIAKDLHRTNKELLLSYLEPYDIDNIEHHIMGDEYIYVVIRNGKTLFILDTIDDKRKLRIVQDGVIVAHANNGLEYCTHNILSIVRPTEDIAFTCNLKSIVAASKKYGIPPIPMLKKLGLTPETVYQAEMEFYRHLYYNTLASKLGVKGK